MADSSRLVNLSQPPPAPPLPPSSRSSVIQRIIAPLAFSRPPRTQESPVAQTSSASPRDVSCNRPLSRPSARAAIHRTGIPIAAIDINETATHAILAGRDILKTVRVSDRNVFEDFNIRGAVNSYVSTQSLKPDEVHKRRQYLPAKDVRWSHKHYSHVVATAAQSPGRIALYDVSRIGSRADLHHLYQHTGQVHKIDFDPHAGYMLLSGSQDKTCKIWDIRDPKQPKGYAQYQIRAPVRDVRWSPTDAMEYALCTEDGTIQKYDIRRNQQPLIGIRAHEKPCYTIAWHPDGKHIVSGSMDKSLKVWDFKSDNRRQKPVFQVRCPAGVMNLAWRPPCWSSEFAENGTWQTTQLATSYTDDDPRTHVWDLRRPHIPFREINEFEGRPADLLWASKDLLWSAGSTGIFAQNDLAWARQPEESLPPCAVEWVVDGSFFAVTEDRYGSRRSAVHDPAAMFLNVPGDSLSVTEEGIASRSLTDDEGTDTSSPDHHHRKQSKAASTRSAKSQANTPPTRDNHSITLLLDRAVQAKKDLFFNQQLAAMSQLPGIHLSLQIVQGMSEFYAKPMTTKQRETDPTSILPRLEEAFRHNANTCRLFGFPDQAKSWVVLGAVILPELTAWADNNRKTRLVEKAATRAQNKYHELDRAMLTPSARSKLKDTHSRSPTRSDKTTNNLFRGVTDFHKGSSDAGSHGGSNMTTPRQLPVLSSPAPPAKQAGSTWFTLEDVDPLQPLPPSLATAHSTAAVASRALLDDVSDPAESPESPMCSHETSRDHRRTVTESAIATLKSPALDSNSKSITETTTMGQSGTVSAPRTQADRRAALRDYKALAKQPLSFDIPVANSKYDREDSHDAAESFPVFPASVSGSAKARSFGQLERRAGSGPESSTRGMEISEQRLQEGSYYESIGRSDKVWADERPNENSSDSAVSQTADFAMDDSPLAPFGFDGSSESRPVRLGSRSIEQKFREVLGRTDSSRGEAVKEPTYPRFAKTSADNSPPSGQASAPKFPYTNQVVHHFNPMLRLPVKDAIGPNALAEGDVSRESDYHASDFRPIDITKYEPLGPWVTSAYHIICTTIEHDVNHGPASVQFSAHLLGHIHPFFFHQSLRVRPSAEDLANIPTQLEHKLLHPAFRYRIIEGIFSAHINFLETSSLSLSAAVLRKLCVDEFGYSSLAGREARIQRSDSAGDNLDTDPRKLKSTCSSCGQQLPSNARTCNSCSQPRDNCPICEVSLNAPSDASVKKTKSLATYCHVCGHSVHLSCMTTWLMLPDAHGECPTPACGCDCGPGLLRDLRIEQQYKGREEREEIRSSTSLSNPQKDPLRAASSPAVEKARDSLRKRSSGGLERATQSSDERTPSSGGTTGSAWSKKGTSASAGRGMAVGQQLGRSNSGSIDVGSSTGVTSLGRRVRVVEPEQD